MSSDGVLRIWGRKNSWNVMKVLWACDELGIPFERYDVGGQYGGTDSPEYRAMNPNMRVPTIDDNGFVLWESNVIVRYLAHKYGRPGLFPEQPQPRFIAEQWMEWKQTTVSPAMHDMFWGLVRTPPEKRDPEAIEASRQACERVFGMLDEHLAGRSWVAGDELTMGDIPAGVAAYRWYAFDIERPDYPHLRAWYERLTEREPYRTHVMLPLT